MEVSAGSIWAVHRAITMLGPPLAGVGAMHSAQAQGDAKEEGLPAVGV